MQWSPKFYRKPPENLVSLRLQILFYQIQQYLEEITHGDALTFCTKARQELKDLHKEVHFSRRNTRTALQLLRKLGETALLSGDDLQCAAAEATPDRIGRMMEQVRRIEDATADLQTLAASIDKDVGQMGDIPALLEMCEAVGAKRAREMELRNPARTKKRKTEGGEERTGWFASNEGYFHLEQNWYSTNDVMTFPLPNTGTCGCETQHKGSCKYTQGPDHFKCVNWAVYEECELEDSPTSHRCQNQKFQKLDEAKNVTVGWTPDRGTALFARQHLPQGSLVTEYRGEVITEATMQARVDRVGPGARNYSATLDTTNKLLLDAKICGSAARFANHDC